MSRFKVYCLLRAMSNAILNQHTPTVTLSTTLLRLSDDVRLPWAGRVSPGDLQRGVAQCRYEGDRGASGG